MEVLQAIGAVIFVVFSIWVGAIILGWLMDLFGW